MSIFINDVAVTTFDPMVKQAYQELGFKLRNSARVARVTGALTHSFPKIGTALARQKALQDDIVPNNLTYSKVDVTLQDWYSADYSDIFGQANVNFDEKRELAEALGASIGRRSDQMILDAADASGTTNTVAAGGTGLTYVKFQDMIRLFTLKNILSDQNELHFAIDAKGQEDLLNDDKFINSRYTQERLFDNGNTLNGMKIGGVNFHVFGTMPEGGVKSVAGTSTAYAWAKSAIGMAINLDFRSEITYQAIKTSFLVNTLYKANAVAIDAEGIVAVSYV